MKDQLQLPFGEAGDAGCRDAAATVTPKPALPVFSRSTDPDTSKAAAQVISKRRATLERQAMELITRAPGHTAKELEYIASLDAGTIHKRISTLVKAGKVARGPARRCRISGYRAAVLLPVDGGKRGGKPR